MRIEDFKNLVYHYRLYPKPNEVPYALVYMESERLLWNRKTASAMAGLVTAWCERHPDHYSAWRLNHFEAIKQAIAISNSGAAQVDPLWAEYLVNRWLILGTDKAAWDLLVRCHMTDPVCRAAAQNACDAICRTLDSKPVTNANGVVMGKVMFEDMRLQMLRLANEYRSLTTLQRQMPFEKLPFSQESQEARESQEFENSPLRIQ